MSRNIYIPGSGAIVNSPDFIAVSNVDSLFFDDYCTDPIVHPVLIPECKLLILTIWNQFGNDMTAPPVLSNNTLIEIPQAPGRITPGTGHEEEMHTYYVINPVTGNQTLTISKDLPSQIRYQLSYYTTDGAFSFSHSEISEHSQTNYFGKNVSVNLNKTNLIYMAAMAFIRYSLPRYSILTYHTFTDGFAVGLGGGVLGWITGYKIFNADSFKYMMRRYDMPVSAFDHICQYAIFTIV